MADWPDLIEPSAKELFSNPDFGGNIIEMTWVDSSSTARTLKKEWKHFRQKGRIPSYLRPTGLTNEPLQILFSFMYSQPVSNARGAGRMFSYFIKKLVQNGLSPKNINLVSVSLGAQMIGYVGKSWNVIKLRAQIFHSYFTKGAI